jgi:outer membrane protein assembly factor BamD (BamD/ComL family)
VSVPERAQGARARLREELAASVASRSRLTAELNAAANAHARFESVIVRFPKSEFAKRAKEQQFVGDLLR